MCTIPYKMVNLKNQNNSKKLNKNYNSTNYHIRHDYNITKIKNKTL